MLSTTAGQALVASTTGYAKILTNEIISRSSECHRVLFFSNVFSKFSCFLERVCFVFEKPEFLKLKKFQNWKSIC